MESPLNWIVAAAICAAAAVAETVLAGKDPQGRLRAMRQPSWSPSFALWVLIGILYFAACLYALASLFAANLDQPSVRVGIALLMSIMAANALTNWLLFRRRDFRAYHMIVCPYAAAVIALIVVLEPISRPAAAVMGVYAAYLIYAFFWTRALWRMNKGGAAG